MTTFIEWTKQERPEGTTTLASSNRRRIKDKQDREAMAQIMESVLKELIERSNVNA